MSHEPVVLVITVNVAGAPPLPHVTQEVHAIRSALEGVAEVRALANPTLDEVFAVLREDADKGRIRVFHFAGHASAVALMLADSAGGPAMGHAQGLAEYLGQHRSIELVVLNGCSTRAQIEGLRRAGVGAVVATTRAIKDDVGASFGKTLYAELASKRLSAAFEAAAGALKTEWGGNLRELVVDEPEVEEEWNDAQPWVLRSEPRLKRWRLPAVDRFALMDELAKVFNRDDHAAFLLTRIGFPRGSMPVFRVPASFWTTAVQLLDDGVLGAQIDGVQAVVDEAVGQFPGNSFFAANCS